MDWSTNLGKLFQARQTIATSKNQAEVEKAKKEEKELLSNSKLFDLNNDGKVNIEDLVSFSTLNKDKDGNGEVSDEEKSIFDNIKDTLYDNLAKNINKNKDLKVDDMLQLEKQIRELDSAQKETIGDEMEKIQNRMVSNLTAQFFVTKETAAYKENAKNGMIEIWEAQAGLDKLNESENNPFNNKLEVLLDKLESRATRTLSEDYTAASIKDAKDSKDISKLEKKTSGDDEDLDESKFSFDGSTQTLKYDGNPYTGYYGSSNPKKYYEEGKLLTGISMKYGKYFEDGLSNVTGIRDLTNTSGEVIGKCSVVNGEIEYTDLIDAPTTNNTVRTYYESYMTHELVDGIWKDKDASKIKKVVTFVGTVETGKEDKTGKINKIENYENGKVVSTETFEYNSDGSYTVEIKYTDSKKETEYIKYTTTGEVFDGNGVFDSKFYKDYKLVTGPYGDRYYIAGVMPKGFLKGVDGIMYLNGEKLTGICTSDGKYYEAGLIKELATSKDGKVYSFGVLANGVIKEEDGNFNYYIAGVKQAAVEKELAEFVTAPENNIQNVRFAVKEDNSIDFTKFTGVQYLEYAWRDVEYDFTDKDNYTQVVTYAKNSACVGDIKYSCEMKNGELKDAKYILGTGDKAVEVDVTEDGSKVGIDYSINFTDIDGYHPVVTISNALTDGLTYIYEYKLDETEGSETFGKYIAQPAKIVLASINDIQTGKQFSAYTLEEGKVELTTLTNEETEAVEGYKITDTRIENVTSEQIFNEKGARTSGTITFAEPAEDGVSSISLGVNDSYKLDAENNRIIVTKLSENGEEFVITTYNNDGTVEGEPRKIDNKNGIAQNFAKSINIELSDIENIEITDGKVTKITIDNVEYTVTEDTEKGITTIKSADTEKQFKTVGEGENAKVVVIKEVYPSFGGNTVTVERNDNGVQTLYRVENNETGNFTQYEYNPETSTALKLVTTKATFGSVEDGKLTQTVQNYAADGKTIIDTIVTVYSQNTAEDGKETSITKYAGLKADDKKSYEKVVTSTGYTETNYNSTTGKKTDEITVKNATGTEPKTSTRLDYKADGETIETKEVSTFGKMTVKVNNEDVEKEVQTGFSKFEINSKDKAEEGRLIEETKFENKVVSNEIETTKTVEKYSYAETNDVIIGYTKETYDKNGLITLSETYDSNEEDKQIQTQTEYINGIRYKESTFKSFFENGTPKEVIIDKYNGSIRVESVTRTYKEDGTYTEVNNDLNLTNEFDKDGEAITKEQKEFAAKAGFTTITDVVYSEDKTSWTKIAGTKWGNPTIISNITTSGGKYSYTEEMTLAENSFGFNQADNVDLNDDIILITQVKNDVQASAKIAVGNKTYNVNVNGAEVNGNLDAVISVRKADENAHKVYVADVLANGVSRERLFTGALSGTTTSYTMSQTVAIASLETLKDATKVTTTPKIEIPADKDISVDNKGTITIPVTDNKVVVHLGSANAKYEIELKENETFTISKDGKITSQYKDGDKTVTTAYTFNEDGGYTKTTADGVAVTYSPKWNDGNTAITEMEIKKVKIGDMTIENPEIVDGNKVKVSQGANEDGKVQYEIQYSLTDGKMVSGKVTFPVEPRTVTLGEKVTAQFSQDGKSVTIVEKKSDALTITSTRKADGKYTALKLNEVTIPVSETSEVDMSDLANKVKVKNPVNSTDKKVGTEIEYSTKSNSSDKLNIGDKISIKILFNDNSNYVLNNNDEYALNNNGSCSVTTVITADNDGNAKDKVVRTFDYTGKLTEVKINDMTIDTSDCQTVQFKNGSVDKTKGNVADASTLYVKRNATDDKIGIEYTYDLVGDKENNVSIGDLKDGSKVLFKSGSSVNVSSSDVITADTNGGCTIKRTKAGINVAETYNKSGQLAGLKLSDKEISVPLSATVEYNTTDKTAKVKSTTDPKCELIYDMTTGALKEDSKLFGSNISAGATVTFSKDTAGIDIVTVKEKDSTIAVTYNKTGEKQTIKIKDQVVDVKNSTVKYLKEDKTETTNITEAKFVSVKRTSPTPVYEVVYNTDGTVDSGKYGTLDLNKNDVLHEGNGYVTIKNGDSVSIYSKNNLGSNLNAKLEISANNLDKFIKAVDYLYETGVAQESEFNFEKVKKQKIDITDNSVSFVYDENNKDVDFTVTFRADNTVYVEKSKAVTISKTATVSGLSEEFTQKGITCTKDGSTYKLQYDGQFTYYEIYNTDTKEHEYEISIGGKTFRIPKVQGASLTVDFDSAKDGTLILKVSFDDSYFELKSDKTANEVEFTLSKVVQKGEPLILADYETYNTLVIDTERNITRK